MLNHQSDEPLRARAVSEWPRHRGQGLAPPIRLKPSCPSNFQRIQGRFSRVDNYFSRRRPTIIHESKYGTRVQPKR